jgi:predicted outer membrane repeat protein
MDISKSFLKKFLTSIVFIATCGFGQTNVTGLITSDTEWALAGSPYYLTGNVGVNNAELTIAAGCSIIFQSTNSLIVQENGLINAQGTESSRIVFTSDGSSHSRRFQFDSDAIGTTFTSDTTYVSGSMFKYCDFTALGTVGSYNNDNYNGNFVTETDLLFQNCNFYSLHATSYTTAVDNRGCNTIFYKCNFYDNTTKYAINGWYGTGSRKYFSCDFYNNTKSGSGYALFGAKSSLYNCNLTNNSGTLFYEWNSSPDTVFYLQNCIIKNNNSSILTYGNKSHFRNCVFLDNNGGFTIGSGGTTTFNSCIFQESKENYFNEYGSSSNGGFYNVANSIIDISGSNIITSGESGNNFLFQNNYWVEKDTTLIHNRINDYQEDFLKDKVIVSPILNKVPQIISPEVRPSNGVRLYIDSLLTKELEIAPLENTAYVSMTANPYSYDYLSYTNVKVKNMSTGDTIDVVFREREIGAGNYIGNFTISTTTDQKIDQISATADDSLMFTPYDSLSLANKFIAANLPDTLNVPTEYTTIQSALNAASQRDIIIVQPGTYTENIIWPETNGIKLISAGDSSNTIIDGSNHSPVANVIYLNPSSTVIDTTTLISGFNIKNGANIDKGAGIYLNNASLTLKDSHINNNVSTDNGGGIYIYNGDINIYNCHLSNNGSSFGGAIYVNSNGQILLENTQLKNNSANEGGALIVWDNGNVNLVDCTFEYNQASSFDGGGIRFYGNGELNISNSTFKNNVSPRGGGAISISGYQNVIGEIRNVDFIGNSVTNNYMSGGAVNLWKSAHDFISCKFLNNLNLNGEGGALYVWNNGDVNLLDCIFENNQANIGGGVLLQSGTISNSTFINNHATNGGGIYGEGTITNVNIISNTGHGIYGSPIINQSNILNNGSGMYQYEQNYTDAINNYWGHQSGPYHSSQNPSGQGDSVSFFVNVDPWLITPNTDAPPIPAQNTTVTSTGNDFISLNWDVSLLGDLAGYKLYYDSDSSGYPYANSVDIGTDTSYTLSSLTLGTTYYLAVTTYDTDGNESWYSNEVTGVTRVMQAQSLDIGGNGDLQHMVSHTPSITFNYYDSMNETQTNYQVQVSTQSDYSSIDMWDSGEVTSSDTSVTYAGTTLEDGQTYHLRARVAAGSFWSDWSALSFRMNTEPTTPVLVSPINDQVTATPVVLNVFNAIDAESDVVTYSFNVYDDATLTTKLDSVTSLTEGNDTTSWQVIATLPDNGQYFWTVSTNDGYEESAVSDTTSFLLNIANDAPATFALTYPADTSEVTTTLPTLLWQASTDPDPIDTVRYMVQFGSTIPNLETFYTDTMTSYQFTTELEDNTDYFWRVIAEDLNGASTGNTGGYHSFRVNTANDLPGDFALISPDDESIVTDLTPTLYWEVPVDPDDRSRSIVSYHVYLDTSLTGTIPDTVSTNSYTVSNLLEDVMYYWKIVAVDDDGGTTESSTWSFWTNSANSSPTAFTLLTPTDGEETSLMPTFSWNMSSDADMYDSISYTLSYGSDPMELMDVTAGSDLTYTSDADLMDNTEYVWQVSAMDQSGAAYTTALQSFTVNSANDNPEGLVLLNPVNESLITELPLVVVWTPATDLDGDSIWYDVHLTMSRDIVGTTMNNYFIIDSLYEDQEYFIMVTANDNNGGYIESEEHVFNVNFENTPPSPFELVTPGNEEVLTSTNVTFDWEHATDPDPFDIPIYLIHVMTDTLSWDYELYTENSTETHITPEESFPDNSIYHWSVTADDMNGGITENIGGPRMFVINVENDPPTASTLVAPLNESIQTDLIPNFYWTEADDPDPLDEVSYILFYQEYDAILTLPLDTNAYTPEEDLLDNFSYSWYVHSIDLNGAESISETSQFYTDAFPEPPANFATVTPENNAEGIATEVEFAWNETDDPDPVEEISYRVVYASNWEDSSTYVYSETIEDTSMVITFIDNSQYYWLVEALDTDGFMVGSNENMPNTMVVGTLSIDGADIPEVFALHQNYPNPFNPTTQIRYDLPEDAMVSITIYDLMGRSIKSLVNSRQTAGYRSIQWNATNNLGEPVSAGMYIYMIQAGKFRQTKKMVLLK